MINMVDTSARIPPVTRMNLSPSDVKRESKLISCSLMISIHLGMMPTGKPGIACSRIDDTRNQLLAYSSYDKEPHTRAHAPFGDDLIHINDE